ncbi:alcohol dehydrogenase [Endobacter medicaginis]|uniref:Alcohol dehydrogenase 2 n=2 Tax=Endobacter medicaginis TaxID=1181271 RepID=A0A839UZW3_9PROT|nr:iron-containing alcohol dehydrogenase [Endobacter medicaginis]MBB3173864.1 alcohol dehydrogenase [Endobacter medicaginis]MCX5476146.1 iron-containing alcohol dehydrogenase [Endobacter medicaginis]
MGFEFRTVASIAMEWGGAARLGPMLAPRWQARRALVVSDAGLVQAGLLAPVLASLTGAGFAVEVFDAVVADPPEAVVLSAVAQARTFDAGLVIGLGGGSSLDIAKLVAVLLRSEQTLDALYGIGKVKGSRAPLVLVPTTAGTGSEVTNISIITTGETTKMGVVADQLFADFVLLDAQLTLGLPALHTAATGIDAMVHAIEAYTSRHRKNPLSDALAREALRLLSGNLLAACRDGTDRAAREAMLLGAMLAGQAFANAPVAAVHALAYPLGGHYHVPHGLSNALMLAPVLRFNAAAAAGLYAELADVVGISGRGTAGERAEAFAAHMQALLDDSGAPRRLRDVGVTDNSLALLAADAMKQTRLLVNNPVELDEADALALYRAAY